MFYLMGRILWLIYKAQGIGCFGMSLVSSLGHLLQERNGGGGVVDMRVMRGKVVEKRKQEPWGNGNEISVAAMKTTNGLFMPVTNCVMF